MLDPTLPEEFKGPSAWTRQDLEHRPESWMTELSPAQISDLEQAARHFLSLGRDIGEITRGDFSLGPCAGHIRDMRERLLHGIGVEVLRGLPVGTYSREIAATIFCGIGAHLGSARSQNADGHILGHVRDTGADPQDANTRIYQTTARQTFHTDSADIVGLLCLREAKTGGDSLLVSAETIYNRMRAIRPDLLDKLFEPIATDRRGEIPEGADPYMRIPVLNWHRGKLTVFYQRQYIESAQRFDGVIPLTAEHRAALDLFDELADDPALHIQMRLRPGDMQFVYNHSQLHDRTEFVDWPEPERRRHLLRLWISPPGDRPLPPCFTERYGSIEIGNRGGIVTAKTRLHAPLD